MCCKTCHTNVCHFTFSALCICWELKIFKCSLPSTLKFYVASRRQDLWSRVSDVYKLNISINLAIHIYVTCYLNPSKFIPRSVISLKLIENSCRKHNNTVNCSHSRTCDNVELVSITSQKPCSTSAQWRIMDRRSKWDYQVWWLLMKNLFFL